MEVGYGFLSIIRSQTKSDKFLKPIEAKGKMQLNLVHDPIHTYLFDEYSKEQLETTLDKIKFFNDVEFGITMNDFILQEKSMSEIFVPIASFHNKDAQTSNDEIVAAIEGVVYPWFGISYRIDRI